MTKKKVQVVITNSSGEILLLKMNKKRGNYWQNVTGGVEENENFLAAAARESIEETGIDLNNIYSIKPIETQFEFIDQYKNQVFEECFHLVAINKWIIKLDPNEHENYQWKKISKIIPKDVHYESNYQAIKKVRDNIA